MPADETVLFYAPDPVLAARAKRVFLSLRIRIKTAQAGQMGQSLGFLLGVKGHGERLGAPVPPVPAKPVMVLSGFSRARMDVLFAALRKAGIPPIDLKAVVTPTNIAWSLGELCAELAREHEAMHGG